MMVLTHHRLHLTQVSVSDLMRRHHPHMMVLTHHRLHHILSRERIMKVLHLYQIKMLDGSQYRGEIAYRDDEKIVLKLRHRSPEQKLRLFNSSIASVRDVGYQKAYALR
jgi:hypothetical protein